MFSNDQTEARLVSRATVLVDGQTQHNVAGQSVFTQQSLPDSKTRESHGKTKLREMFNKNKATKQSALESTQKKGETVPDYIPMANKVSKTTQR